MSGGEYTTFTGDKGFEQRVVDAAKHARNRYLITFSPSDPTPGLHTIRVRTAWITAHDSWRGPIIGMELLAGSEIPIPQASAGANGT
jgi:hypothetical protein